MIKLAIRCLGAAIFVAAFSLAPPASAEMMTLPVPNGISSIEQDQDGNPIVVDSQGARHIVVLKAGRLQLEAAALGTDVSLPEGALPDGVIATSTNGDRAWLAAPTKRYRHGVLGDGVEAGALVYETKSGKIRTLTLSEDMVFEDRYPRFADMDGDGDQEILVVKAYANAGGALVLIDPSRDPLAISAEADAIGTPNRWLNPVGMGDVDGDGRTEVLVVITPHIGGTLNAYEWQGDRLVKDHAIYGFSNHVIGARELALSAVEDLDGDGISEAIVPSASRRVMTIVRFDGSEPIVIAKVSAVGGVVHRLVVNDLDGDHRPELVWGSGNGSVVVWKPKL
jgi:hypothetical protein